MITKNTTIKCHACKSELTHLYESHRGMITNRVRGITSNLITNREMLKNIEGRGQGNSRELRDQLFAMKMNLQTRIINDEEELQELKRIMEECHYG